MWTNPWARALTVIPLALVSLLLTFFIFSITSPGISLNILELPGNVEETKRLYRYLAKYYHDHSIYVVQVFVLSYLYKQAFNIPGSTVLNILAGALFGQVYGTLLCSVCAAAGATLNYLISDYFFKDLVIEYFPSRVQQVADMVSRHRRHGLFFYLLSMRVLPMMPNFLMNAINPIVGVPMWQFFFSVLIGLLPYQYACVRSGLVIASLNSSYDVFDWDTIVSLIWVAILFLIPALLMKRFTPPLPPLESETNTPN